VRVHAERETSFALHLRVPAWTVGGAHITVNGQPERVHAAPGAFATIRRKWKDDLVRIELPFALTVSPIPDEPQTVAFMEGPVVLAGLCEGTPVLHGDLGRPEALLASADEREWGTWRIRYQTVGQERATTFVPLYEVVDEPYSVYFPVRGE
jgi:hypothetical protein